MKKILYICNRCGREITTAGIRIIPHYFEFGTDKVLEEIEVPDKNVHFCMNCTQKVMQEIRTAADVSDEKVTKELPDKKSENKRPRKAERLDAGKVMALHRAGWENKKIADEMGVTERQIYQCIRYQINKNSPGGAPEGKETENEQ